jgi:uncharacterized membrane protein (DUF373 family)
MSRSRGSTPRGGREPVARPADRALQFAENAVYAATGVFLVVGALIVMGSIAYHLVRDIGDGADRAVTAALDGLLLVFILLELLSAVRATMTERRLVAEPFLVVGIIAAIKEIVVTALDASELSGERFDDAMINVGVLASAILLLSVATFLIRRKEREPIER